MRSDRSGVKLTYERLCRIFSGMDAVGYADAVIGAAGKREAGKRADGSFDISNPLLMADVRLRHGIRVAPDAGEKRLSLHAEQTRQLVADIFFHGRIIIVEQLRLQA